MGDPFKITGPAVVSFSGGESSGMMLRRVIEAHGGALPPDVLVCFENTGRERPETLDFVERCSCEWGVPVVWLEYRYDGGPTFAVVDYASASRSGEPFEAAATARGGRSGFLPNPRVRYCTIELKIKTLIRYLLSLGWEEWTHAIGFRADEPQRVAKARAGAGVSAVMGEDLATALSGVRASAQAVKEVVRGIREPREDAVFPLHAAGITKSDVRTFWDRQPFRLQLGKDEGNCDLCFLKGQGKLERIMRERPDLADWWIRQEERRGTRFRNDRPPYAAMLKRAQGQQLLPGMEDDEPDELSVACHCTD